MEWEWERVEREWERLRRERAALQHEKEKWFDSDPRGRRAPREFCFVLRRMRRSWREMDRERDLRGRTVDATVGSTEARRTWFTILDRVLREDQMIRVRHRYHDEPALVVKEATFRRMEGEIAERGG